MDCNVDTVVDTLMVNEGIIGGKWCRGGRGGGGGGGTPINFTTMVLLDSRNSKKHFRKIGENLKWWTLMVGRRLISPPPSLTGLD